jgi:hypothetical protein
MRNKRAAQQCAACISSTQSENKQEITMKSAIFNLYICLALLGSNIVFADDDAALIASAKSAAPPSVTSKATIKAADGKVLQKGSNSYTCYPQQPIIGPMCNEEVWDALIGAMLNKQAFSGG